MIPTCYNERYRHSRSLNWYNDTFIRIKKDRLLGFIYTRFAGRSKLIDKMYLQLQSKSRILDLHLTSGLHDWDMNEEIKLTTTTDQFYHGNIILVSNSLESAKQGRLLSITEVSWFGRWQADWPVSGAVALRQNLQKIITSNASSSSQEFSASAQRQRCVFIRHITNNIISYLLHHL